MVNFMSLRKVMESYKKLREVHFKILRLMEVNLNRFEYVPIQFIAKKMRIKINKLEKIMDFMLREKIVKKRQADYVGYALTYKALDILALRDLEYLGVITSVDRKIGVGKEGDIWIAYFGNMPRILKFYRLGKESFKRVRVHRAYYVSDSIKNWFEASKKSARREFRALKILYEKGVKVPEPITLTRHVIVMGYIDGKELTKAYLLEPKEIFIKIIREVVKALKAGFVHADLSEFNVMVTADGEVYLIDWPQYVTPTSELAPKYFERDVKNLVKYFVRKYHLDENELYEIVERVMEDESISL